MATLPSPLNKFPTQDFKLLSSPQPPYYVVISSTIYNGNEKERYETLAAEMGAIVDKLPGYLGLEVAFDTLADGRLHTLAAMYWDSLEAIQAWRDDPQHIEAKKLGKSLWYPEHNMRVCQILRHYGTSLQNLE